MDPSTPVRPTQYMFGYKTPDRSNSKTSSFGTPVSSLPLPSHSSTSYNVSAPKYSNAAMRMGLAHSFVPRSMPDPVRRNPVVDPNLLETRVLGAYNKNGVGWIEKNGAIARFGPSRRRRLNRRRSRRVSRRRRISRTRR